MMGDRHRWRHWTLWGAALVGGTAVATALIGLPGPPSSVRTRLGATAGPQPNDQPAGTLPSSVPAPVMTVTMPPPSLSTTTSVTIPVEVPSATIPETTVCSTAGWSQVNSGAEAPPGTGWTWLNAVGAISPIDAWAVGGRSGQSNRTLAVHWNGVLWSVVPTPDPGSAQELTAVAARASDDVWAVGYQELHGDPDQPLIEHWNGRLWSVTPSPQVGPQTRLEGVTAISATDAWAVGQQENGVTASGGPGPSSSSGPSSGGQGGTSSGSFTVIEHWDGRSWSLVPTPSLPTPEHLAGVAGDAPDDVWAVGGDGNGAMAEHWDGRSWTVMHAGTGQLAAVAVLSGSSVWAVGSLGTQTLVEHWNGHYWSTVPSPSPAGYSSSALLGVTAVSPIDAWAVGEAYGGASGNDTLVERWAGTRWSVVPSPSPDADDLLHGVSADGAADVWAVGVAGWAPGAVEPSPGALAEHFCKP